MIKAVVFDMGGVLVGLNIPRSIEAYETGLGFHDIKEILDNCHHKGIVMEMEAGIISREEFISQAKEHCNPGTSDQDIVDCQQAMIMEIPSDKAEYIKRLHERYPLYILSNNNPITMPACEKRFEEAGIPLNEYFGKVFISSEMKMLKPGKEIYLEAIRQMGYKSEELLFVDDSPANVAAGAEVGMKTVHYIVGTSLEETVENALSQQ